ncbi:MAG: UDP-2,4-diacetamido-2,4,6-trideoxy-beta-L-altropyranose hydrolase [Myxococcales bacterium]|nr:UDP-2,4-diacetamido-2,4,6-trideoxy-beta-L-altropyranose hydrolase [Myxococcales bacterium]
MSHGLILRANASVAIGAGHVMRLLALAEGMRERGADSLFLLGGQPEFLGAALRSRGFAYEVLSETIDSEADLLETSELARQHEAMAIVVDGYDFTSSYLEALNRLHPTVVMDDLADRELLVDIIVNGDMGAEKLKYRCAGSTELLLGTDFTFLRSEFLRQGRASVGEQSAGKKLVITFGGSDPGDGTARILSALTKQAPLDARVVLGSGFHRAREIQPLIGALVQGGHLVETVCNPPNMAQCLAWADSAVSAAGGTLWELSYLGIPTAAFAVADNQVPVVHRLRDEGMVFGGVRLCDCPEAQLDAALSDLIGAPDLRGRRTARYRTLIDGLGVGRVLDATRSASERRLRNARGERSST